MHKACFWKIFSSWVHGYAWLGKNTMKEKFCDFSQNVRSLRKKINLLVENILENKMSLSVIGLSETCHSDDTPFVKIVGYEGFFAANHKTIASGLAVFVDQNIQVNLKDLKDIFCFDVLVVDLFLPFFQKFSLIVIHNAPSNTSEFFLAIFEKKCWKRLSCSIHSWL